MSFCEQTANIWQLLGYVVTIIKIVIPLILIIFGMIDLGKAVILSKDDAVSKAVTTLIKRFVAAVIVFFVPTIVNAVFSITANINLTTDATVCIECITSPNGGVCDKAVDNQGTNLMG